MAWKVFFLLTIFVSSLDCLADAISPSILDGFPSYVVSLSMGPMFTGDGQSQTIYVSPFIKKTYAANKNTNVVFDGELFLGIQQQLRFHLQSELGLAVAATTPAKLSGDIWDFGDMRFNNSSYTYQVQHTHIAAKGRLIANIENNIKPYLSGSLGAGFNQAYDFVIIPMTFAAVAAPNFTSTKTTGLTYTVGLGVQRTINEHWRAGIGYEFADWGKNQLGPAAEQTLGSGLVLNQFYANGIQFSIYYYQT